jgi:hypothetical protein
MVGKNFPGFSIASICTLRAAACHRLKVFTRGNVDVAVPHTVRANHPTFSWILVITPSPAAATQLKPVEARTVAAAVASPAPFLTLNVNRADVMQLIALGSQLFKCCSQRAVQHVAGGSDVYTVYGEPSLNTLEGRAAVVTKVGHPVAVL